MVRFAALLYASETALLPRSSRLGEKLPTRIRYYVGQEKRPTNGGVEDVTKRMAVLMASALRWSVVGLVAPSPSYAANECVTTGVLALVRASGP